MLSRFPNVKLPYETTSNLSVLHEYNTAMAISYGKRAYAWFTYYEDKDVCCILELNRENAVGSSVYFIDANFPSSFSLGTIVSGTIFEDVQENKSKSYFIVENIFMFKGQLLSTVFSEKTGSLLHFFQELPVNVIPFVCAVMWVHDSKKNLDVPEECSQVPYTIRYIQYRSSNKILPLLNVSINKKPIWSPVIKEDISAPIQQGSFDYSKPIYKQTARFMVMAEIPHDVYFLYLRENDTWIKFQHALILNYKTSIFMNGLFRFIKENQNLDYMEESDDEDEFQDLRDDKYVDLKKQVYMECAFSTKFKLWTPIRVVDSTNLPSIDQFIFSRRDKPRVQDPIQGQRQDPTQDQRQERQGQRQDPRPRQDQRQERQGQRQDQRPRPERQDPRQRQENPHTSKYRLNHRPSR